MIIILSFDIAPFPCKHDQRRITSIVKGEMLISTQFIDIYIFEEMRFQ